MNYELAKKLKEAGWPQKQGEPYSYVLADGSRVFWVDTLSDDDERYVSKCYIPTLEELIDACDKRLWALFNEDDGWYTRKDNPNGMDFKGSTPIEAVANLYLSPTTNIGIDEIPLDTSKWVISEGDGAMQIGERP